ncbi:MAG: endolytic transglycosylase MltG, partial [Nitrospinota bacterium]
MTRRRTLLIWGTIPPAALAAGGLLWLNLQFHRPLRPGAEAKVVDFPRGSSLRAISARLEEEGLIRTRYLFSLRTWLQGRARSLQAGEYRLSASMSPAAILEAFVRGDVVQHALTIPEGYTVREIARAVEDAGIGPAGEVEAVARDPALLRRFDIDAPSAEGYLFPETYHFPRRTPPRKVLGRMIAT